LIAAKNAPKNRVSASSVAKDSTTELTDSPPASSQARQEHGAATIVRYRAREEAIGLSSGELRFAPVGAVGSARSSARAPARRDLGRRQSEWNRPRCQHDSRSPHRYRSDVAPPPRISPESPPPTTGRVVPSWA
jgi:hypothetical protein